MREARFVGPAARLGVSDSISVQLVSYRAQIKDKIIAHLLYIHFDASQWTCGHAGGEVCGTDCKIGSLDSISVRLVSYRTQITDKIMTHHLYIHIVASYVTSEMRGAMLRSDSSENRSRGLNICSIGELQGSY